MFDGNVQMTTVRSRFIRRKFRSSLDDYDGAFSVLRGW